MAGWPYAIADRAWRSAFCLACLAPAFHAQVKPAAPVSKSPQQAFILRSADQRGVGGCARL